MEEIDLKELIYSFWKGKMLIVIFAIIGLVLGIIYQNFLVTPMYRASTSLVLAQGNSSDTDGETATNNNTASITQNDINLNQKLVSTYGEIIKSRAVAKDVIDELKLNMSIERFISNINVQSKQNTELLLITVSNEVPEVAAKIANHLADAFADKVADVFNINNVSVIDVAEVDNVPYNINLLKTCVIFTFAAIILAFLILFIKFYFNNSVNNEDDVEKVTGLPVLAVIPKYEEK